MQRRVWPQRGAKALQLKNKILRLKNIATEGDGDGINDLAMLGNGYNHTDFSFSRPHLFISYTALLSHSPLALVEIYTNYHSPNSACRATAMLTDPILFA